MLVVRRTTSTGSVRSGDVRPEAVALEDCHASRRTDEVQPALRRLGVHAALNDGTGVDLSCVLLLWNVDMTDGVSCQILKDGLGFPDNTRISAVLHQKERRLAMMYLGKFVSAAFHLVYANGCR